MLSVSGQQITCHKSMAVLLAQWFAMVVLSCQSAASLGAVAATSPHVMPLPQPGPSRWQAFTINAQTVDTKHASRSFAAPSMLRVGYCYWKYV